MIVASYCTTFLKPEMLHIYRQVTGLKRHQTFIVARERECPDRFPFDDIEMLPPLHPRLHPYYLKHLYLKHIRKLPPLPTGARFSQ